MKAERLAALIALRLPDMMRGRYNAGYCLSSTRITLEVARALGVPARALAVECVVANRRWAEILEAEGWPDEEQFHSWVQRGAWSVGALPGRRPGDPGHLVAILGFGRNWLSDCALAQFRRPQHGLTVPDAITMQLPSGFHNGEFAVTDQGSYSIAYRARPQYRDYTRASGWIEPARRDRHIIDALIASAQ